VGDRVPIEVLRSQLHDSRSGRVLFVSHCLRNEKCATWVALPVPEPSRSSSARRWTRGLLAEIATDLRWRLELVQVLEDLACGAP
jgi:hypothetical protein